MWKETWPFPDLPTFLPNLSTIWDAVEIWTLLCWWEAKLLTYFYRKDPPDISPGTTILTQCMGTLSSGLSAKVWRLRLSGVGREFLTLLISHLVTFLNKGVQNCCFKPKLTKLWRLSRGLVEILKGFKQTNLFT
jgi:hypothetical protein